MVRLVFLARIVYDDVTATSVTAVLMSAVEPSLAVILACIPLMRPLVKGRRRAGRSTLCGSDPTSAELRTWRSGTRTKRDPCTFPKRSILASGRGHALKRLGSSLGDIELTEMDGHRMKL